MTSKVDWDAAERLGVVLPLSGSEYIDILSAPLHVSGALEQVELPQPLFQKILGQPMLDATDDIKIAAHELLQIYGEKAVMVASDRATLASYARNEKRRDFWVAVFTEVRRTHRMPVESSVNEKA
ncbi:hypothetical protein IGS75_12335 [Gluconobacter sphaericus]|uniref:hypothetical protein n=1 Tax=Gluconobacter sphaericus TaxID=574987 RepID=UPI001923971A|nr:hypothetical protein [Gluconobacter sphaericus]QQX90912.1 hypothetical protein IGS75_12335 [Gluconobacter sphaericus]